MSWNWRREREEYLWLGPLVVISLCTFLVAAIAGALGGVAAHRVVYIYMKMILMLGPVALGLAAVPLLFAAIVLRVPDPLVRIIAYLRARLGSPALLLAGLGPLLIVPLMMGAFGTLKMLMPLALEFTWDDRLAALDRVLFLGNQPWELTHAVFGNAAVTQVIDIGYTCWVAMLFIAVLYYALLAPRYARARFFLSFIAAWLLIGVIGAYAFASAGPCYTAIIGAASAPEFAPLMERLKAIHEGGTFLAAYDWQGVLWDHHVKRAYAFGMGVSAMPSMHNAIAVLYALSLSRGPRWTAAAGWVFAGFVFIGSIHLGWHYAVDGIGAGLMMWGVWAAAGAWLDRVGYGAAVRGEATPDAPEIAGKPVAI
jgi:hypothetical protein